MAKSPSKLLKAKTSTATSHNAALPNLLAETRKKETVPFQVLLDKDLAIRVKVFGAENGKSHKRIVTEALTRYLDSFVSL
jgi:hypothetical protein